MDNLLHLGFVPKVARIQAETVNAAFNTFQGQLVMKVDVSDQRYMDLLLDFLHGFGGFHVRYRASDNLAAHFFQLMDLANGGSHVPGIRFGHGLDGYVSATANLNATDRDWFSNSTFIHRGILSAPYVRGS
ncbi:hypothetical protein MGWOODY_Clf2789 [hydrothermal vent metagenome]|uniref:Uncharacterized protein n=1 Tax=hydrothermal vent metagenome TaxID=652676 RepID=A0A161K7V0_9ZZZZ